MANAVDLKSTDFGLMGSSPITDTIWIAWAAGLFEGEGSIFLVNQKRSNGKTYSYPRMELKMTDKDVVEKFKKVVVFGNIHYKDVPSRKDNHKVSWCWQLTEKELCERVLSSFWPYLGKRRRAKIIDLGLR